LACDCQDVERQIRIGQYQFDRHRQQKTLVELIEHYTRSGALEHHRSATDTLRHLKYWKSRLGSYALVHITTELLGSERQYLAESPTSRGEKRTSATVNRYMASLSALLTYAARPSWLDKCKPVSKTKKA